MCRGLCWVKLSLPLSPGQQFLLCPAELLTHPRSLFSEDSPLRCGKQAHQNYCLSPAFTIRLWLRSSLPSSYEARQRGQSAEAGHFHAFFSRSWYSVLSHPCRPSLSAGSACTHDGVSASLSCLVPPSPLAVIIFLAHPQVFGVTVCDPPPPPPPLG